MTDLSHIRCIDCTQCAGLRRHSGRVPCSGWSVGRCRAVRRVLAVDALIGEARCGFMPIREGWRRIRGHGGYDDGKEHQRWRFAWRTLERERFEGRQRLERWQGTGELAFHDGQSVRGRTDNAPSKKQAVIGAASVSVNAHRHWWAADPLPSPPGAGAIRGRHDDDWPGLSGVGGRQSQSPCKMARTHLLVRPAQSTGENQSMVASNAARRR